jgi:hypothetical protein
MQEEVEELEREASECLRKMRNERGAKELYTLMTK